MRTRWVRKRGEKHQTLSIKGKEIQKRWGRGEGGKRDSGHPIRNGVKLNIPTQILSKRSRKPSKQKKLTGRGRSKTHKRGKEESPRVGGRKGYRGGGSKP